MNIDLLESLFDYHKPDDSQVDAMEHIRSMAKFLAVAINNEVPESADKSAAIRLLRQCVQSANAGIVLNGAV